MTRTYNNWHATGLGVISKEPVTIWNSAMALDEICRVNAPAWGANPYAVRDEHARLIAAAPELRAALETLSQAVYDAGQWLNDRPAYQNILAHARAACAVLDSLEG